jgi:hypothetical protein
MADTTIGHQKSKKNSGDNRADQTDPAMIFCFSQVNEKAHQQQEEGFIDDAQQIVLEQKLDDAQNEKDRAAHNDEKVDDKYVAKRFKIILGCQSTGKDIEEPSLRGGALFFDRMGGTKGI